MDNMTFVKPKRTSWVIVLFLDSKLFGVVPIFWIFSSQNILYSKWPPGPDENVTSDIIHAAPIPHHEWPSYKVRLLDNGREYYNFNKAWYRKIDYVKSSTESETSLFSKKLKPNSLDDESDSEDDAVLNVMSPSLKQNSKRSVNVELASKKSDFLNIASATTSNSNVYQVPQNIYVTSKSQTSTLSNSLNMSSEMDPTATNSLSNESNCSIQSQNMEIVQSSQLNMSVPYMSQNMFVDVNNAIPSTSNCCLEDLNKTGNTIDISNCKTYPQNSGLFSNSVHMTAPYDSQNTYTVLQNGSSVTCNSPLLQTSKHNTLTTLNTNTTESVGLNSLSDTTPIFAGVNNSNTTAILLKIASEQNVLKLMQERILSKLEVIEINLMRGRSNHADDIFLDSEFFSHFPMNNKTMFLDVEYLIKNDASFTKRLEYFIKSVGGHNPKNHIKRALGKLFTNCYATNCTITGRGKDITTKIGDSELLKIFKKVIKDTMVETGVTDADFEKVVADWFRYSNTRLSRSNQNLDQPTQEQDN